MSSNRIIITDMVLILNHMHGGNRLPIRLRDFMETCGNMQERVIMLHEFKINLLRHSIVNKMTLMSLIIVDIPSRL